MGRRFRDDISSEPPPVSPVADDSEGESAPLGVKLCCVVGVLVGFDHVPFVTNALATGRVSALVTFVAVGAFYSSLLYGLWMVRHWGWAGSMMWFTVIGAFSVATMRYGPAIVCFLLVAYLKNVEHVFRDARGYKR
ncbi:hypothetical protein AB7C87_11580 [Natrarchaeobius sp. A-rgal3]|uniref:hypothetical protein n=1 Tax=Natrarchaeobius versutus TaxID=1679078 RepID=UPI00350EDE1A